MHTILASGYPTAGHFLGGATFGSSRTRPAVGGTARWLSPTPQAPSPQDPFPLPEQVHAELQVPTASPWRPRPLCNRLNPAHTQPGRSSPEHPGKLEREQQSVLGWHVPQSCGQVIQVSPPPQVPSPHEPWPEQGQAGPHSSCTRATQSLSQNTSQQNASSAHTQDSHEGVSQPGVTLTSQHSDCVGLTHVCAALQVRPSPQPPQDPPQPSSPHCFPVQSGVQPPPMHVPEMVVLTGLTGPAQSAAPIRSAHFTTTPGSTPATRTPLVQIVAPRQIPQTPPQPSVPHSFPLQSGVHTASQLPSTHRR